MQTPAFVDEWVLDPVVRAQPLPLPHIQVNGDSAQKMYHLSNGIQFNSVIYEQVDTGYVSKLWGYP